MKMVQSKREIITTFQNSRERLLGSIAGLPDTLLTKSVFAKGWSVKDVFSHLCYWDWWKISAIDQIASGILPPYFDETDDNEVNEREVKMRNQRSWEQVSEEFSRASGAFLEKLENTDEQSFNKHTGLWWKDEKITISWLLSYVHYDEHVEQIVAWRQGLKLETSTATS